MCYATGRSTVYSDFRKNMTMNSTLAPIENTTSGNVGDLVHLFPISGTDRYRVVLLHTEWYAHTVVSHLVAFANHEGTYDFSLAEAEVALHSIRPHVTDTGVFIERIKLAPESGYKIAWDVSLDGRAISDRTFTVLVLLTLACLSRV
jgi:hypothetical protein